MNVFKADMFYMLRDKTIRVLLILSALLPITSALIAWKFSGKIGIRLETMAFQSIGADIMGALLGVGMSNFFGHDFVNNTIRNKVCYGESRTKITLLSFVESFIITAGMILTTLLFSLISSLFSGNTELSESFWTKYICQAGILFAFAFVITALTLCTKNSKPGIFTTIIMTIFVSAAAQLFPKLASIADWARVVSRSLYMTVSNMMMNSVDGTYTAMEGVVYDRLYLNSLLIFVVYSILSVSISLIVVNKQSYK